MVYFYIILLAIIDDRYFYWLFCIEVSLKTIYSSIDVTISSMIYLKLFYEQIRFLQFYGKSPDWLIIQLLIVLYGYIEKDQFKLV